jgi:Fe-S cluster assembly protein SufD
LTVTDTVRDALEIEHVQSHLNPPASYDLADHPVPTGREETWRFTPLKRLRGILDGEPSEASLTWETSLPEGVTMPVISRAEAREQGALPPNERPAALAMELSGACRVIDVPADFSSDEPILVTLHGDDADALVWSELLVKVGRHARATLVITHTGTARYSAATSVVVGDGAELTMVTIQDWDDDAVHLGRDAISVGRDATVRHAALSFGGDVVRMHANVESAGPGDHTAPRTRSHVSYKGALQGAGAHTVWVGNVLIRKVAEGIDTFEENRNLVLTDGCQADSIPNLEIETGEIEGAGHASATGRFDDEQLFYLRSRGIDEHEARRLVVHGFFNDLIRKIGVPAIEEKLVATVEAELAKNVTGKVL